MDFVFVLYTFLLSIFNIVAVVNLFSAPRLRINDKSIKNGQLVSAIIPMRNEENNAKNIIDDLLTQDYKNLEIIAVNDNSEDNTLAILREYGDNIKIVNLTEHDKSWIGKSWAIWNGLQVAKGEDLLFLDADTRLAASCVGVLARRMDIGDYDVINCFPYQKALSLGETLILPLMTWSHVGHVPIALVNKSMSPIIAMANGQFIMCTRSAYDKIGGHEKVKGMINEDISLIRIFKRNKFKVLVILGGEIVSCRMYTSFAEAFKGFGRSLTFSFDKPLNLILLITFWMAIFFSPIVFSFFDIRFLLCTGLIYLHRLITSVNLGENPIKNMFLHFFQMITLFFISFYSLLMTLTGKVTWKGRPIKNIR